MKWNSDSSGYGAIPVALHWLTLILIVAAYATMDLKGFAARGTSLRQSMAMWHYTAGLSVFVLTWLRLCVRFGGGTPVIVPSLPALQLKLATLVKIVLYAFMICMPLLGWLTVNAKGHDVIYLGWTLPALTAADRVRADFFKNMHETLAIAGYFLIGLHALAALFHHYVKRDNTLRMMWFRH